MKIFEKVRNDFVILGVNPTESYAFNWKIAIGFLVFGLGIFLNAASIFSIENNNLITFVKNFCEITGLVQMSICLLAIVLQKPKLFGLIESIEKLINKRNRPILMEKN